ncbi:MAG TPA: methylated-DNA--[protein]-cysteine S-methyltransferase [Chromatiales bacterium]|nr:methylated-DNA--[protein]-cysteine S-methyltransferase [Chromatiales bacterium]
MTAIAYQTPVGVVTVTIEAGAVTGLRRGPFRPRACRVCLIRGTDPLSGAIGIALQQFFHQPARLRGVPLRLAGTPFQQRVWHALQQIPPGEVRTYGDLARQLGSSPRAVGGACRRNPVPLLVPCHRVVAAQGIGGFAGHAAGREVALKRWLLRREGVTLEA